MGPAVDMQVVIEEVGLNQAGPAMGTQRPDLAMTHLAGRETGHHAVFKTERGVHVINWTLRASTAGRRQMHD